MKSAGQHRKSCRCRAECLSDRDHWADHSETLGRDFSRWRASGGGPCSGSPQSPSGEAVRRPLGPRAERGRANVEPRANHGQRELHRPSADRTPSVPEAARSGRQPFAAAAAASIDNRPPASRHHSVPKSVAPSPALNVRLISALHKFLQGRGGIVVGAALQAPPVSRRPLYATTSPGITTTNGLSSHCASPQQSPERQLQHRQHKPLTCGNRERRPCTTKEEMLQCRIPVEAVPSWLGEAKGPRVIHNLFTDVDTTRHYFWSCQQNGVSNTSLDFLRQQHTSSSS